MFARIRAGQHKHILLTPEQAVSKEFRSLLKDLNFSNNIGLVAIDELHFVEQWKEFRAEFTMLGELRAMLSRRTVWFGCSATIPSSKEASILLQASFRPIGTLPEHIESPDYASVIRTTIDRADLTLSISPIPRNQLTHLPEYTTFWTTVSTVGIA